MSRITRANHTFSSKLHFRISEIRGLARKSAVAILRTIVDRGRCPRVRPGTRGVYQVWSADLVVLEFALERDAGDAQRAGGLGDVALVLVEDLADVARLEVGARRAQAAVGLGGRGRRG